MRLRPPIEKKVAPCTSRQMQPATHDQFNASTPATQTQQGPILARARAILERNKQCNSQATMQENSATPLQQTKEDPKPSATFDEGSCMPMQQVKTSSEEVLQKELHSCSDVGTQHATSSQNKFDIDNAVLSGDAVKVYLPPLNADVWLCFNQQIAEQVKHEELVCFLYEDLVYIHQGKPGDERLSRLFEIYARRHPLTAEVLNLFNGKITSIKPKAIRKH